MSEFSTVLFKEFKSMIRDPRVLVAMFIIPFALTGLMYFILVQSMKQSIAEAIRETGTVIVLNNDRDYWSINLTKYLEGKGYRVVEVGCRDDLVNELRKNTTVYGLIIPSGFSSNLSNSKPGFLEFYFSINSLSMTSSTKPMRLYSLLYNYSRALGRVFVEKHGLNSTYIFNPISTNTTVFIRDLSIQLRDPNIIASFVPITSLLYPLLILLLSSFLIQLTATSIAVEKEDKMLETILSLPISRFKFILAKITASIVIGFIGLAMYAGLMIWFFSALSSLAIAEQGGVSSSEPIDIYQIANIFAKIYGIGETALMVVNLAVFIVFILGLSIVLSLFAEDVRSAQLVTQYLIIPLALVLFINMFIDFSATPHFIKYSLSIIPIVNTGFIPLHLFNKDYISTYITLFSTLVYALASIYIASKLVASEKIFTLKIFRKFRK